MNDTSNLDEVNRKIEKLVGEYLAATRGAFVAAAQRVFEDACGKPRSEKSSRSTGVAVSKRASGRRRGPEEVAELGGRLLDLVRERPGESMVVFAAELGTTARERIHLIRPCEATDGEHGLDGGGEVLGHGDSILRRHQRCYFAVDGLATGARRVPKSDDRNAAPTFAATERRVVCRMTGYEHLAARTVRSSVRTRACG